MHEYDDLSDEALLERFHAGEREIEDYLLNKYKELVKKKARARFLLGGDNDDLVQEGMIGLFKAIRDYRADRGTSFRTFAGLCIDRQIATAIESSRRQKHQLLNTAVPLDGEPIQEEKFISFAISPEELLIERENQEARREEIRRLLSPMEKQVMDLYSEGLSYADIAETLGKSVKSVDNTLRRIRSKIRDNPDK